MSSGGMQPTSSGIGFQNSTSWNSADPQAAAAYRSILDRGLKLSEQKYQPYKGQLVAGFSPDQLKAFQGVRDMQGIQNPYIEAAKGYTESAVGLADPSRFSMDSLNQYMNPFQQNVIDATMANMRNMNQTQLSDLTGRAISSGAMGGDRSGVAKAEYLRGANLNNNQTLANLQSQNYQQAVQQYNQQQQAAIAANQAAAAGMSGLGTQAQQSRLADLQALLGAGGQQQQQQQRGLDVNYQRWQQARSFPYQQLQFLSGLASGIGPLLGGASGTSGFSTSQQSQQQPGIGGQLLGGLFSLGGLLTSPYGGGTLGGAIGSGLGGLFSQKARGGAVSDRSSSPYGGDAPYVPTIDLQPAKFNPPESHLPDLPSVSSGSAPKGMIGEVASKLGGMTSGEKAGLGKLVGLFGGSNPIQLSGAAPSAGMGSLSVPMASGAGPHEGSLYADGGRVGLWAGGPGEDDDRPSLGDYIEQRASEAGYNPKYLKAVMDYESSTDPNRWGGKGGNYYGLIQFGPQEREKYGIVPGKTDAYAQTDAAINFLRDRGYKPNMGLEDMYSTVLAGSPGHYNRADQNGSVAQHVAKMRSRYGIDGDGGSDIGALAYSDSIPPRPARDSGLGAIDAATTDRVAEPENKPFLSPEVSQALMAAGLGMMASRSPNLGTAIGEGGLMGLGAYQNALASNAERAKEARREKIEREKMDAEAALRKAQIGHYETEDAATKRKIAQEEAFSRDYNAANRPGAGAVGAPPATSPDLMSGPLTGGATAAPASSSPTDNLQDQIAQLEKARAEQEGWLDRAGSDSRKDAIKQRIHDINDKIKLLTERQTATITPKYQKTAEKFANVYEDLRKDAAAARGTLQTLNQMKRQTENPNFVAGAGADYVTTIKKAGQWLGLSDEQSTSPNEVFNALSGKLVMDAAGGSLGVGISSTDRDYLASMNANAKMSPVGIAKMIDLQKRSAERKLEVAKMANEYARAHGGLDYGWDDYLERWTESHPLVTEDDKRAISGGEPAATTQAAAVPSITAEKPREYWIAQAKKAVANGVDRASVFQKLRAVVPDATEDFYK